MKAPCYGCTERHYLCHSECKHYKAFTRILEARHRADQKEANLRDYEREKYERLWMLDNGKYKGSGKYDKRYNGRRKK